MSIRLDQLTKRFGNQLVLDSVSLEVSDGELFVLLGASGSGKSTVLRLIAGLLTPDSGRIFLGERDITWLAPQKRDTGFVFQNYSIFRHMTVAENIEFGLDIRKVPAGERGRRRDELLDQVGLAGLGGRYAHQLSGGQQQRVALARALAYEPAVLLLDEPFGALDVKIRSQLRRSLKQVVKERKVTTILVTHDQEEAFELADRIGIIERGHLLEIGDAPSLYARPKNSYVASFLGSGTLLVGRARSGVAHFGTLRLPIPEHMPHEEESPVQVLFRPEEMRLTRETPSTAPVLGQGTVIEECFLGGFKRVRLRLPRLKMVRQIAPPVPFGEDDLLVDALVPAEEELGVGTGWCVSASDWHILKPPPPRLLVCDSGKETVGALRMGGFLANQLRGAVTVLHVSPGNEVRDRARENLKARLDDAGLTGSELRLRFGKTANQILIEQYDEFYQFLIVNFSDRPSGQLRRLSGSLTMVLEQATIPVLVAKGDVRQFREILICTAAGEPGKSDVRMGGWLARRLGSAVTLLYVSNPGDRDSSLPLSHLQRGAATLRSLDVGSETKCRTAATAAEGILAEAKDGAYDLIVVGSHRPSAKTRSGLDDVTLQILTGAAVPVLVVPGDEDL
jgi:sulfate/thiosulfate transport system ATP-binding protein